MVQHADIDHTGITGTGSGGAQLLAYKSHSAGDETTGGTSLADVDATNAAVTFTAPASGNVLVRLSGTVSPGTTNNAFVSWGLREASSDIAGAVGESIAVRASGSAGSGQSIAASMSFVLTGVTAGSHTYKWSHACSSGTGALKANASKPAIMEVWSLP